MNRRKIINRRAFCVGMLAAGTVRAANPLIDLSEKSTPLIDLGAKQLDIKSTDRPFIDIEPRIPGVLKKRVISNGILKLDHQSISLTLKNIHTDEDMFLSLPKSLKIDDKSMSKFNYLCRDWRIGKVKKMDPKLLSIIAKICEDCADEEGRAKVEILSAYRSQKTNEMLRSQSNLVAKNSFHLLGKALDFRLPGIDNDKLRNSANTRVSGGLGIYKNFVHIDTGPQRRWII